MARIGHFDKYKDISYGEHALNKLDLYLPNKHKATATIVFFYGGCWGQCTNKGKRTYLFVADTLTKQGYAVVIADYRQYPEVKFKGIMQDAKGVMQWTIKHAQDYDLDEKNIFVMGHSSGAHIGAMLVDNEEILKQQLSSIRGFIGLAGPYDFYPFIGDYMYDLFDKENNYYYSQPVNFVNGNEPPQLILQGQNDNKVHPNNATRLADKLKSVKVECTLVQFEKMRHGVILGSLSKPLRRKSRVLENIVEFVEKHKTD
jgi:acetyl esterase/lipase